MESKKCGNEGCENLVTPTPGRRPKVYCSDKCRISAFLKKKQPPKFIRIDTFKKLEEAHKEALAKLEDCMSDSKKETPVQETDIKSVLRRPQNLEELKSIAPENLSGLDKSEWISKTRQDYGF